MGGGCSAPLETGAGETLPLLIPCGGQGQTFPHVGAHRGGAQGQCESTWGAGGSIGGSAPLPPHRGAQGQHHRTRESNGGRGKRIHRRCGTYVTRGLGCVPCGTGTQQQHSVIYLPHISICGAYMAHAQHAVEQKVNKYVIYVSHMCAVRDTCVT